MKTLGFGIAAALLASMLSATAHAEDLSGAAYSTCQMFALDRLPSRSGVHFPGLGERGTGARVPAGRHSAHYEVISFVDTRGPAGIPVRRSLYCELRFRGDDQWTLERIVIDDGRGTASLSRPRSAAAAPAGLP